MASVQREEVREWAKDSSPIVQVQGVEKGPEESNSAPSEVKQQPKPEGKAHVHDSENIKTTYDVEEDAPPSLYQKFKGKFLGAEDSLRSKDALNAKHADPHPALSPEAPGILSKVQQNIWGKRDDVKASPEPRELRKLDSPVPQSFQPKVEANVGSTKEKKEVGSSELGTGYEEDSETGTISSQSSTDSSDAEDTSGQSESLFKPIEAKDESETTLEDLRENKLNQNSSTNDVQAPGAIDRLKEEVEAVTDQLKDGLNLKEKRAGSGDQKENIGLFSRIAEKIGFGGHSSQSS